MCVCNLYPGRGGARSSSRAAKVALMKMKLHAVGEASTPQVKTVFNSKTRRNVILCTKQFLYLKILLNHFAMNRHSHKHGK